MGSFSILNNISSITGQHLLNINNFNLNRTLNRMSSGMRINSGADDAAGLQIADSLRANVSALNQATRNANDGISFLQIADGALGEITNMLTRMVTLAEEAANEPIDEKGRQALNTEFQEIQAEIARLALQTNFNGTKLFDIKRDFGETLDLFVGDLSGPSSISVVIGYITVTTGADGRDKISLFTRSLADATTADSTNAPPVGQESMSMYLVSLGTHNSAANALTNIRECLNEVSNIRGVVGAGMNRLQAAISVMQTQARNTLAAESQIRDANMAEEITNLTKYQILAQTGIAALAHANTNSQIVLNLLR